jgi:hypothetical protein
MNSDELRTQQNPYLGRHLRPRSQSGAGIIAIGLFLAFFAVLPLSLLYFEMGRYNILCQQVHNITDFAALSGTAALASSSQSGASGQTLAMQQAVWTIAQNGVLQTSFGPPPTNYNQLSMTSGQWNNIFYSLNQASPLGPPTQTKTIVLNITLRDQNGQVQSTGSDAAVTMAVAAMYMDSTVFASQILPIQSTETAAAFSLGGLPALDMILCFDISGSMDDGTSVYLVNRCWSGTGNFSYNTGPGGTATAQSHQTIYKVVTTNQGTGTHTTPDTIYNIFQPTYTGTSINIMPPQGLQFGSYLQTYPGVPAGQGVANAYIFSESPFDPNNSGNPPQITGLRAELVPGPGIGNQTLPGVTEQGCPAGNYNGLIPDNRTMLTNSSIDPTINTYQYYFTDMIPSGILGITTGGKTFTDIATCVEASRGNLESPTVYTDSQANVPSVGVSGANGGWYTAYWGWVRQNAVPIASAGSVGSLGARQAAVNFFNTMNSSSNAHFGLVTFASTIGATPGQTGSTVTKSNIDPNYSLGGGTTAFPLPLVSLDQVASNFDSTNQTGVTAALLGGTANSVLPVGPIGATDIADALQSARTQLTDASKTRIASKKAIILFTDGVPNLPGNFSAPDYGAFQQATLAGGSNIPVFTIGLSQNQVIQPYEIEVLGDGNEDAQAHGGSSQGIAAKSGNLAHFFLVTNAADLNAAFQAVARSLVVLQ